MQGDLTDAVIQLCQTGWATQLVTEGVEAAIRKRAELGPTRDEIALVALPFFLQAFAGENTGLPHPRAAVAAAFDIADAFLAYRKENPR